MLSRNTKILVCFIILAMLVGCGADVGKDIASPTSQPVTVSPTPKPISTTLFESPLQPTVAPSSSCLSLIEPVGNTICGYIKSQINDTPIVGRPILLAQALFSEDNSVALAALDKESAPQGITDAQGMFYVVDVPPDMYFLMIDNYPQPIMLKEPDAPDVDLYVDWRKEGGSVDLGIVYVDTTSLFP